MIKARIGILICLSVLFLATFHTESAAKTLFSENFSKGADRWEEGDGEWAVENGEYVQKTTDFFTASFLKKEFWDPAWTGYTLELKAMKLEGDEGWDIVFGAMQDHTPFIKEDRESFFDWNLGGWTNTRSALRKWVNGSAAEVNNTDHTIETGKWYKIKIEVSPTEVVGYLDDEWIFEHNEGPTEGRIGFEMFATSAAYDDIIIYDAEGPGAVHPGQKLTACWGGIRIQQ